MRAEKEKRAIGGGHAGTCNRLQERVNPESAHALVSLHRKSTMSDTPKEGPSPDEVDAPSDVAVPADPEVEPGPESEESVSGLARPIQDHLAQQLRTAYHAMSDKPAFLGDPVVPAQFDQHIQRLEIREKAHDRGIQAVKAALRDIGVDVVEADDLGSPPRRE